MICIFLTRRQCNLTRHPHHGLLHMHFNWTHHRISRLSPQHIVWPDSLIFTAIQFVQSKRRLFTTHHLSKMANKNFHSLHQFVACYVNHHPLEMIVRCLPLIGSTPDRSIIQRIQPHRAESVSCPCSGSRPIVPRAMSKKRYDILV